MRTELARTDVNFSMVTGDSIQLTYTPYDGTEQIILTEEIKETIHIDVCIIYKFENEFGLKEGYIGVFGKK